MVRSRWNSPILRPRLYRKQARVKKVEEMLPHTWIGPESDAWRTGLRGGTKRLKALFAPFPAEEKELVEEAHKEQTELDKKIHGQSDGPRPFINPAGTYWTRRPQGDEIRRVRVSFTAPAGSLYWPEARCRAERQWVTRRRGGGLLPSLVGPSVVRVSAIC